MPDLFSSSTGDSSYNLFFGPREQGMFNWYNTELLEMVSKQNLNYWVIEADKSNMIDIYGEAEKKVTRDPIKIYAWIMMDEPEIIQGQFGTDRKRRIEVYAHKDRLTEVGLVPRIGDFLEWDNEFFEIHYADVPNFVHGHTETKIGVTMRALSAREDKFNPYSKIDGNPDADSENPY